MHFLALILLFLSTLSIMNGEAEAKAIKGFSIKLIHRDSPLSPFYNSSLSRSDLLRNAALRSIARVKRFQFHRLSVAETSELAQTDIIPNDGNYLMKIFIGTPPIETLAIADTGSDLIWVQCTPCPACYPQNAPLFDPNNSSTYTPVLCDSQTCSLLPSGQSGCENPNSNQCVYEYEYGDKSFTVGDLATESINFGTTDGQTASFPPSVFGCGHNNSGTFRSTGAGLVGLGHGPLSLVSQLGGIIGRKFSYCLPPFSVQSTTELSFGEEATISGSGLVSTPLVNSTSPTYYSVALQGITIGQQMISQTNESDGNIVIDSGTTLTILAPGFYEEVEALMKEAIGADEAIEQNPPEPYKLCYASQSINNFPQFVVHFEGADVSLNPENFFLPINNLLCFAVVPQEGISIYGDVAQFNFQVEYDLDGGKVSFAPANCTQQ